MKKCMLISLVLIFAVSLIACSAGNQTKGQTNEIGEKKVELRMLWWGSQTRHDLTQKALKLFEDKHPNIKIKPEFGTFDGYFDKLSTQVAGGNAPDVIQMDPQFLTEYAKRGALLDLTPFNGKEINTSDHEKAMIDNGTVDGKLYAICLGINALGIVYNETVLQQLGMNSPKDSWTWKDLADITAQIHKAKGNDYYGILDQSGRINTGLEFFSRQYGQQLFTNDGKLNITKQVIADWFALWEDMRKTGGATPPELTAASPNGTLESQPVILGKAAMGFAWSNQLGVYQKAMKNNEKLNMAIIPAGINEKQKGEYLNPSQYLTSYSKTAHPKEAAMLIDFLVNDPDATKILGPERGIPSNSKVRETLKKDASDTDRVVYDFIDKVSKNSSPIGPAYPKGFTELNKSFIATSELISFGQKSSNIAIDQFMSDAQKSLGGNK